MRTSSLLSHCHIYLRFAEINILVLNSLAVKILFDLYSSRSPFLKMGLVNSIFLAKYFQIKSKALPLTEWVKSLKRYEMLCIKVVWMTKSYTKEY